MNPSLRYLLATFLLTVWALSQAAECGPAPGGPPATCEDAPASLSSDASPDAAAGNPINVMTGNKYQREVDMPALPGILGLEIVRHYNSAYVRPNSPNGPLGREWRLSYETTLFDKYGKIQILQADGRRIIFDRDRSHPNLCSSRLPGNGSVTLKPQPDRTLEYLWIWPNGRRLQFNRWGKLTSITAPSGEVLVLQYDSGQGLVKVIDPLGRSLHLTYRGQPSQGQPQRFLGVSHIDSPVGRFSYQFGGEKPADGALAETRFWLSSLVRVDYPPTALAANMPLVASGRRYHHEDTRMPWLLTGISITSSGSGGKEAATRFSTYGYDSGGRANLSTHAGGADRVTLDFKSPGITVLTNSLGQRTTYRHAIIGGEHRLQEVRGPGCATCGPGNIRYAYNDTAQLLESTELDATGRPLSSLRYQRNALGHILQVDKITFGSRTSRRQLLRIEYDEATLQPRLIAQPSVVPGKEHQTRIAYNSASQPLTISETGWIPAYDGKQAAAQIELTRSYRYAQINGRSLLTAIDGPLPNGKSGNPGDSDITVLEYDNRTAQGPSSRPAPGRLPEYQAGEQLAGLLTRIVMPGERVTQIMERDAALRPVRLRSNDGDLVRDITVRSNWRGQPLEIELAAGNLRRKLAYEYDVRGRLRAFSLPGGARSTLEYNPAGRLSRVILPDGSGLAIEQDTEQRIQSLSRNATMPGLPGGMLSQTRFSYEDETASPGRLAAVRDNLGLLYRYRYDDAGQVTAIVNALGTVRGIEYDGEGRFVARVDAAGSAEAATWRFRQDEAGNTTLITAPNNARTTRRYDDFGRKVMEADPDRGISLFRHDAAGRVLASMDATGMATQFRYDHAGRLLAVGKDRFRDLLRYRYRGSLLAEMASTSDGNPVHIRERLDYRYDALGQLISEDRWLADVNQPGSVTKGLRFLNRYAYDHAGRLVRHILPDGHTLQYRYNATGQLLAILFDETPVVSSIESSIMGGLTGYTMSSGARQQLQPDARRRMVLMRTVHREAGKPSYDLYRQHNRYDRAGRLDQIDRSSSYDSKAVPLAWRESFGYDALDRLTSIRTSQGGNTEYRYDNGGNRIATIHASLPASPKLPPASGQLQYHYARNGNWLLTSSESAPAGGGIRYLRSAWFYHEAGLPLALLQWPDQRPAQLRRIVHNSAKRPVAVYEHDLLVARYHYNSQGERISKTVYPASGARGGTHYFLYQHQRLAAETDGQGRVTAHYIYLFGRPVAKIEMAENAGRLHRLWKTVTFRDTVDSSDSLASIYDIVTDHLGTPQVVLNAQQKIIWQAATGPFGETRLLHSGANKKAQPFELNLRLPGQVYDAETGLHYNYLRDYDPTLGRYLAPDPMGLAGGTNPYVYVSNNPLTSMDPLGLYQIDVHYYMTFFLAITAGVDKETARQIALATQYVDDNPVTEPMLPNGLHPDSLLVNQAALER
ncbi:DUF6765 family protein [Oxalobacteraceae bacterium A2-2]